MSGRGGHFTIDAQAKRLADELSPAVTVPVHYRQAGAGFDVIGTLDQFTKLCGDVATYSGSELELTPQISRQTAVLEPQNAGSQRSRGTGRFEVITQ